MNNLPRTLRTPLNSPNTPYLFEHSNHSKRVKHFEQLGLSYKLKEIDFNALQCVGGLTLRTARTARTDTNNSNTRITRMDRMDRIARIA